MPFIQDEDEPSSNARSDEDLSEEEVVLVDTGDREELLRKLQEEEQEELEEQEEELAVSTPLELLNQVNGTIHNYYSFISNLRNTKSFFERFFFFVQNSNYPPFLKCFFLKLCHDIFYSRRRRAADYGATTSRIPFSKPRIRSNNNKIHLARPYTYFTRIHLLTHNKTRLNIGAFSSPTYLPAPQCDPLLSHPKMSKKSVHPPLVTPTLPAISFERKLISAKSQVFLCFCDPMPCSIFDFPEKIPLFLVATFRMVPQNCMPSWVKWKNK